MHGTLPKKIKIQRSFAPTFKDEKKEAKRFCEVEIAQPFTTAIIDPDWPYTAGFSENHSGYTRNKEGKNIYAQEQPLSIDELAALPIGDVVGGYVFLWVTGPFLIGNPFGKEKEPLTAARKVLNQWGFEPCSIITWAKYNLDRIRKGEEDGGYGGVGFWFLGNAEFCIVAKRTHYFEDVGGERRKVKLTKERAIPSIRTGRSSLFIAPKTEHSEKPNNIHELCETRFQGPYLEIFGRRPRDGWTVIGNEAPGHKGKDIRESLRELIK